MLRLAPKTKIHEVRGGPLCFDAHQLDRPGGCQVSLRMTAANFLRVPVRALDRSSRSGALSTNQQRLIIQISILRLRAVDFNADLPKMVRILKDPEMCI